jgi:DNA-binding beta-propeller fold protein YncE
MKSPHGLVVDRKHQNVYSVGRNGKLITFAIATGKIKATNDVTTGVDQIALDGDLGRLYCPGAGKLTVLDITHSTPTLLGEVSIPKGVHTLTVDPTTHDVWLAYGDATGAHFAQYKAN